MQKGDIVECYHDPYSQKQLEEKCEIVEVIIERSFLVNGRNSTQAFCKVRFVDGTDEIFERTIHIWEY